MQKATQEVNREGGVGGRSGRMKSEVLVEEGEELLQLFSKQVQAVSIVALFVAVRK